MTYAILKGQLIKVLVDFFEADYRRIARAFEVLQFAELIINRMETYYSPSSSSAEAHAT
jgi:hypothetical protein